jgi:hypothetical protein
LLARAGICHRLDARLLSAPSDVDAEIGQMLLLRRQLPRQHIGDQADIADRDPHLIVTI